MERDEVIDILTAHAGEIRAMGVTRLALFGSIARGEAGPDSDVDLLVDIDKRRRFSLLDLAGLRLYFRDLLSREVEVTTRAGLKPFLMDNILAEAVEIYPKPRKPSNPVKGTGMAKRSPRQRLQDILDAIIATDGFVSAKTFDDFRTDMMLRQAVERNVEIISEASRHLPEELTAMHDTVPWCNIRDIGNILRHGYEIVDQQITPYNPNFAGHASVVSQFEICRG